MADPSTLLKVGQSLYSVVQKPAGWLWNRVKIRLFKMRNRKPPFSREKAEQLATSVLGGDVRTAIPFRGISTRHVLIASVQRSSTTDSDWRVFLLEQLGATFRLVWESKRLSSFILPPLEVADIDDDGNYELIYEENNFGTGGGSRTLSVYFPASHALHSVTESLNWQNLSGPISPVVTMEPEGAPDLAQQIENFAAKRGFLKEPAKIDFDKPEFAAQRWHRENGKFPSRRLNIYLFEGPPQFLSTTVAITRGADRIWISFFKGVLVEYDPVRERYFGVYSPAWFYNWVTCMCFDGDRLWCGVHSMACLLAWEPATKTLAEYEKVHGEDLPHVSTISYDKGVLILIGVLPIPTSSLPHAHLPASIATEGARLGGDQ